jgi:CHAT domain-containing protein
MLIGIGDPVLRGRCGEERGDAMVATQMADVLDSLRDLPRLCGSRAELQADAATLRVPQDQSLYMEMRATKPRVMELNRADLGRAKVVVFATHALIGGSIGATREPALVLTPPPKLTADDNGLLAMSDILTLRLSNSDWVILSACNTAAPDGSGEGLSGMVRAFFHAGAPSLLVSHWGVDDQATRFLMIAVLQAYADAMLPPTMWQRVLRRAGIAQHASTTRSQALQRGILALLALSSDPERAYFAHPYAWAPFFIAGEGGAPPIR